MVFFILKRLRSGMVSTYRVESCRTVARSTPTFNSRSNVHAERRDSAAMKWTKKTPDTQGVGRFLLGRERPLAKGLNVRTANARKRNGDDNRENRREGKLLLPPAGAGAGGFG